MRNTPLYFATTYCWFNNIFIVVKPTTKTGVYKLAVSENGKEKVGHQEYHNHPVKSKVLKELPSGIKKEVEVLIPSVHLRIKQLYLEIYYKNINN